MQASFPASNDVLYDYTFPLYAKEEGVAGKGAGVKPSRMARFRQRGVKGGVRMAAARYSGKSKGPNQCTLLRAW